jgi:hypothetical protein
MKRLAFASMAGTALEYYDFAVYNTLAALVFNKLFFPAVDPLTGTLLAFATYWVGIDSSPGHMPGIVIGEAVRPEGRTRPPIQPVRKFAPCTGLPEQPAVCLLMVTT